MVRLTRVLFERRDNVVWLKVIVVAIAFVGITFAALALYGKRKWDTATDALFAKIEVARKPGNAQRFDSKERGEHERRYDRTRGARVDRWRPARRYFFLRASDEMDRARWCVAARERRDRMVSNLRGVD